MIVLRTTRFPGGNQRKNNNIRSARDASTTDAVILAHSNRNIRFGLKRTSSEVNEPCRWRSGRAIRSLRGRPESPFFLEQGIFRSFFLARRRKRRIVRSPPRRAGSHLAAMPFPGRLRYLPANGAESGKSGLPSSAPGGGSPLSPHPAVGWIIASLLQTGVGEGPTPVR